MTSHPDAEALAFFAEKLLESDEEHDVAAHIESCDRCAATLEDLTEVSKVLATVSAPALPQELTDLLDRQITEAARERTATGISEPSEPPSEEAPDDEGTESTTSVTPLTPRRRRFTLPRLLVVAAAAVFVVGAGTAVINGVFSSRTNLEDTAAPLIESEEDSAPDTALTYTPEVVRSGTVYTDSELAEQATETWDRSPLGDGPEDSGTTALHQEGVSPPEADEYAAELAQEIGLRVVLVDDSLYGPDGDQAWVMFAQDEERVEVFVMDPERTSHDDITDNILANQTLEPR